jgi:16S rRNA processing protein RimM
VRARTSGTCSRLPDSRDETSPGDAFVRVGVVGRPHGVDGAFVVEDASEDPRRFEVGSTLHVDGEPAAVELSRRAARGRPAIKLDRAVRRGAELFVRRADLPPLEEGSYYVTDLVGLEVVEDGGKRLGAVVEVVPGVANDVLELDSGLLLPLVEDCVRDVQLAQRRVVVAPGFADDG